MSELFFGEIQPVGYNWARVDTAKCDGAILTVGQNHALFALLGGTYGGNGVTDFALPDLRGRVPIGVGTGHFEILYKEGNKGGEEAVTLTIGNLPSHTHTMKASSAVADKGREGTNANRYLAEAGGFAYSTAPPNTSLNTGAILNAGGGQAHNNMQPTQVINFLIALQGIFPSRN